MQSFWHGTIFLSMGDPYYCLGSLIKQFWGSSKKNS